MIIEKEEIVSEFKMSSPMIINRTPIWYIGRLGLYISFRNKWYFKC